MTQLLDGRLQRVSERIAGAVGTGFDTARHTARRAGSAADDLVYNTSKNIKRHPARSMLASFGVALAAGMLIGRGIGHR